MQWLALAAFVSVFGSFFYTSNTSDTYIHTHIHVVGYSNSSATLALSGKLSLRHRLSVSRFAIGPRFKQPKLPDKFLGECGKGKVKKKKK